MKDFKTILAAVKKIDFTRQQAALATVVKVTGSSYRSPGARMLITSDGRWVGSISGGCLEGDALRKARQVMRDQKPMTVTYDTRQESNQQLGISLGCNGVIDVLIEPIGVNGPGSPLAALEYFTHATEPLALATLFSGDGVGQKLLITESGRVVEEFPNKLLAEIVRQDLCTVFQTRRSEAKVYDVDALPYEIFLELIQPTITLLVFGGGMDARPVTRLAKTLGWTVHVTDECAAHLAPVFFPDADKLSLCQREFIDRDFAVTPYTACLLMSHNYSYDRDVLKKILPTATPYIGIMGPRKRVDKMESELAASGFTFTPDDHQRIHAPVGLDIGAEAPDEIAVSIVAEIQSWFSARPGGYLKHREGPIHRRSDENNQVYKQAYADHKNT